MKLRLPISGIRNENNKLPLIPLRGCPKSDSRIINKIRDEPFVGFLSYSEILRCLEHHDLPVDRVHRSIQNVLAVLSMLSDRYGDDRVRLVFEIQE